MTRTSGATWKIVLLSLLCAAMFMGSFVFLVLHRGVVARDERAQKRAVEKSAREEKRVREKQEEQQELEAARAEAAVALEEAKAAMQDLRNMGVDVSDLELAMTYAEFRWSHGYDKDDFTGEYGSKQVSGHVIAHCASRREHHMRHCLVSQSQVSGVGHVRVVLDDVERSNPDQSGLCTLTIRMTVRNIDTQGMFVLPCQGYLIEETGVEHKPNLGGSLWATPAHRGTTVQGDLSYDVPVGLKRFSYVITYSYDYDFGLKPR